MFNQGNDNNIKNDLQISNQSVPGSVSRNIYIFTYFNYNLHSLTVFNMFLVISTHYELEMSRRLADELVVLILII